MELHSQKRLSAEILKCGKKRVWFDEERLSDIKEAITKQDLRRLVNEGAIREKPEKSISRGRAKKLKHQRVRGMRRGVGSRKGKKTARLAGKTEWMNRIRLQRYFIKSLRDKSLITKAAYRELYLKSKGGFFRNLRHIKLYIEEHGLIQKKK